MLSYDFQVIIIDKKQFRPSSNWFQKYIPRCVSNHPKFIENNPIILYVTNQDSQYLPNEEYLKRGTMWITAKDEIPKPQWGCEYSCISSLHIK